MRFAAQNLLVEICLGKHSTVVVVILISNFRLASSACLQSPGSAAA